ncbi:outer membrane beta-barrel protein [Hymenobacter sp. RP-2-7]|uniref:Outer membrane beta-barrel protein n=1 Tax=Hymenobacter polaris TaxID=2682546 RepID=A0A7Y0AEP2_9BACT|nr:outer membrane beta-barrel protein [Hymenobacter polaris]NML66011.1 outer membrane beta-barrel protein [Hymenobacter polaris]
MNEGPDFQPRPDDDDARDPLLGALRQRLGERFGQEPPPELWASIRQQLPAATPRPWWLRSRQLLALLVLLGGVLLGGTAVWLTQLARPTPRLAHRPATQPIAPGTAARLSRSAAGRTAANLPAPAPDALSLSVAKSTAAHASVSVPAAAMPGSRATTPSLAARNQTRPALGPVGNATATKSASHLLATATGHRPKSGMLLEKSVVPSARSARSGLRLARATPASNRQPTAAAQLAQPTGGEPPRASAATTAIAADGQPAASAPATDRQLTATASADLPAPRGAVAGHRRRRPAGQAVAATMAPATTRQSRRAARQPTGLGEITTQPAASEAGLRTAATATSVPPAALDSLAVRRVRLPLATLALPAPLAARPDSAGPWLPPVRRWSVLALAGPTISYRALGQPFSNVPVYTTNPTNTSTFSGRSSSSASLVDLERPAAGLGAQVQVRRVLTGRWALALGAGYQEYATQLNLRVQTYQLTAGTLVLDTVPTLVRQRDTYRFLTLPVQLSYALGPPRGRWSLGLLAGLEPSLYMGGRTTENSTCSCQQQVFTSASGSPYSALTLGLSLGLDARYRLGGPAARWQWVLQPTGRYVATRFVRAASLAYTPRQPFSFGLLTGLAWEF